jgi:uncharacterized protein (TIGR00369 family)
MSPPALTREQIQGMLGRSTFISFLGLEVVSADSAAREVSMRLEMRPEFERVSGSGQWHGGPIAAVIDTVGDYTLAMLVGRPLPTINFRVDYLRPAVKTALLATARVRANGKTIGVVDVDIADDRGEIVAIGRATYATRPPDAPQT